MQRAGQLASSLIVAAALGIAGMASLAPGRVAAATVQKLVPEPWALHGCLTPIELPDNRSYTTLDAATFAQAVRDHWSIENRLHWVLDMVFTDDLSRLRRGHAPENMAVIRHMATNLLHRAKPTTSLKNRRKRAGWNTNYLQSLIRQTA